MVLALLSLLAVIQSRTIENWRDRVVYQIQIDRFSKGSDTSPCTNLTGYCGGTFQGIIDNVDYLQSLGVTAVWLSQVLKLGSEDSPFGNPIDYELINPKYGTEEDFINLINVLHSYDIYVMIDAQFNSIGKVIHTDFSEVHPFNRDEYFHKECLIDFKNTTSIETCWVGGFPDLAQENPFVSRYLLESVIYLSEYFEVDAFRFLDSIFVSSTFWSEITLASKVPTVGTVLDTSVAANAKYEGPFDSVVNHPLYMLVDSVFAYDESMANIPLFLAEESAYPDDSVLFNFLTGFDFPRFSYLTSNSNRFYNAMGWLLSAEGIPVIYYGEEQGFSGGEPPNNNEPLWGNFNTTSEEFRFIQTVLKFRKDMKFNERPLVQLGIGTNYYIFIRGHGLVALTNSDSEVSQVVTYFTFYETEVLCNVLDMSDCVTVKDEKVNITLNGMPKFYQEQSTLEEILI